MHTASYTKKKKEKERKNIDLSYFFYEKAGRHAFHKLAREREYKMYMENERKKKQRASGKPRCKM
jgi:hypothetical protein